MKRVHVQEASTSQTKVIEVTEDTCNDDNRNDVSDDGSDDL